MGFHLSSNQGRVRAVSVPKQLLVFSLLDDLSFLDDKNTIGTSDRRKPMSHNHNSHGALSSFEHIVDSLLNGVFTLGVKSAGSLICKREQ